VRGSLSRSDGCRSPDVEVLPPVVDVGCDVAVVAGVEVDVVLLEVELDVDDELDDVEDEVDDDVELVELPGG
jgi:hypothetical protein